MGAYEGDKHGTTFGSTLAHYLSTNLNDFGGAIVVAREMARRAPHNSTMASNLGYFTLSRRNYQESEGMLRNAFSLASGDPSNAALAARNLGVCVALAKARVSKKGVVQMPAEVKKHIDYAIKHNNYKINVESKNFVWQYRNNLTSVWREGAAEDDTGEVDRDLQVVEEYARMLE